MRTAITRAVEELANENIKVFKTAYDKATWLLNDRLVVSETLRIISDPQNAFVKRIPTFTPKKEIKASIKRYLKTVKEITFKIQVNQDQLKLL